MPGIADPHFNAGDFVRRLKAVEDALRTNGRNLAGSTIGAGGIVLKKDGAIYVQDANGTEVMRIGLMTNGDYGIEAIAADGSSVHLSTLAFGEKAEFLVNTGQTSSLDAWQDLSYGGTPPGVGPVVDSVEIGSSGTARLTLTSVISANPAGAVGCAGFMGILVEGPTTIQPVEDKSSYVQLIAPAASPTVVSIRSSTTVKLKNLKPGLYRFTAKYLSRTANALFSNREVIVQPY